VADHVELGIIAFVMIKPLIIAVAWSQPDPAKNGNALLVLINGSFFERFLKAIIDIINAEIEIQNNIDNKIIFIL